MQRNLALVKSIATRVHRRLPPDSGMELCDLVQEGVLGLMSASASYDGTTGAPFASYARFRIRGAMLDSLRKLDTATRVTRRWQRALEGAEWALWCVLHRKPTRDEVDASMGTAARRARAANATLKRPAQTSRMASHVEDLMAVLPAGSELHPDVMTAVCELRDAVQRTVGTLDSRTQSVVTLYAFRELTLKQVGKCLGISESRACQMYKRALGEMAKTLKASGIRSPADLLPSARGVTQTMRFGEVGVSTVSDEN